ncbi:MAG TPA: TetR/AcrR family transcriptional regulator [Bacteroidetes bacterium]|nr:TetR/AcrR family transcriptional regulator [Bacteroidota bacterium]
MKFTPRQTEIINAATELIGISGVQNLTTKSLAAKMGFSEPALYRHFKDKNEIIRSILLYFKGNMGEGLKFILFEEKKGLEKILDIIGYQFKFFVKYPAVIMVIFSETSFQDDKSLSLTVKNIVDDKRNLVKEIILSGQKDGSIRNDIEVEQLTNIVMGSMRITVLNWRLHGFNFDLLKEGQKLQKTIEILFKNK